MLVFWQVQVSRICTTFDRLYPLRIAGFFMERKDDRIAWAASLLEVQPADHLLEIGCGTGSLITAVAGMLASGSITGVDRSPAMIAKTARRNQAYIDNGQLTLCTGAFSEVTFPRRNYDRIFAFNVNLFLENAAAELTIVRNHLTAGGTFYLFYQPPPTTSMDGIRAMAARARVVLQDQGFGILATTFKKMAPAPVCGIVSRPD